jgi:hypothetical protein
MKKTRRNKGRSGRAHTKKRKSFYRNENSDSDRDAIEKTSDSDRDAIEKTSERTRRRLLERKERRREFNYERRRERTRGRTEGSTAREQSSLERTEGSTAREQSSLARDITNAFNGALDNIVEHIQDMDTSFESTQTVYNYRAGFDSVNYPIINVNYEYKEDNKAFYIKLFSNLHELYTRVGATDKNWQFVCIVIRKNRNNYQYMAFKPYYTNFSQSGSRYLDNDEYNNKLSELINYHIRNVIQNANLGGHLKDYLDRGEFVNIAMDYYIGRTISQAGWHVDTRRGNSLYTSLTYNNNTDMLGPELAYYEDYCSRENIHTVFRPIIYYPFGSVGINDNVIIHSTPYTKEMEEKHKLFENTQYASIYPNYEKLAEIRDYAKKNNLTIIEAARAKNVILNNLYLDPRIKQYADEHNMTIEDAARRLADTNNIEYKYIINNYIGPATTEVHSLPKLSPSIARRDYIPDSNLTRPTFIRCHITHHKSLREIDEIYGVPPEERRNLNSYIEGKKYFDYQILDESIFNDGDNNNIIDSNIDRLPQLIINDVIKRACEIKPNAGG